MTFTITGTSGANFDKGWIAFRVRANASGGIQHMLDLQIL
jgi:hypothetical protein